MLEFGDKVRDKVTEFEGIIVGKAQYSNGCNKYAVQGAKMKEDGRPSGWEWIDAQQVELVEAGVVTFGDVEPGGGPMQTPP